jgi:hypothetical protein
VAQLKPVRLILCGAAIALLMINTGCVGVKVTSRAPGTTFLEPNLQEKKALNFDLGTFSETEPLYRLDELSEELYEKAEQLIKKQYTSAEDIELLLFKSHSPERYYAVAALREASASLDGRVSISVLKFSKDGSVNAIAFAETYLPVNLAKIELVEKDAVIVLRSQHPFSAYEDLYRFELKNDVLRLEGVFDQDLSVQYFDAFEALLDQGDLEGAMDLEDTSLYPLAYEKRYFGAACAALKASVKEAKVRLEQSDSDTAADDLIWGLEYYLYHYGDNWMTAEPETYLKDVSTLEPGSFGYAYQIEEKTLSEALVLCVSTLKQAGRHVEADFYQKAADSWNALK